MKKNIVFVGDGYVGKTSILNAIKNKKFEEQIPNIYDDYEASVPINGKTCILKYIDTAGQEEFAMFRAVSYKDANLFLLCFAVNDRVSYENLEAKWIPDLQEYKAVPIILIGTKCDLRATAECIKKEEIMKFQKKISALFYMECSAKTLEGIENLQKKIEKVCLKEKNCIIQ